MYTLDTIKAYTIVHLRNLSQRSPPRAHTYYNLTSVVCEIRTQKWHILVSWSRLIEVNKGQYLGY